MPRKTKKISTAKRAGTDRCGGPGNCSFCNIFTIGFGLVMIGLCIRYCFSSSTPEEYACYQHREEGQTVARVLSTIDHGYDVEVKYEIETQDSFGPPYHQERSRFKSEFADLYKKLDNCDRYHLRAEQRLNDELVEKVHKLETELYNEKD